MKKKSNIIFSALLISMLIFTEISFAQYNIPSKMNWWYEARFGMFIHFGSYSYLAHGEWAYSVENWTKTNYQTQVSTKFNPTNFNAGTIARLAKKAGMKYLVITAKHHEGFAMWQTAVQSFKDVSGTKLYDLPDFTSFGKRDVLQELKDSCDAVGIKFCLYYSILDWNHSSQEINRTTYYSNMASMTARTNYIIDMKAQLSELITKYHPAIMWFDGDWTYNSGSPTLTSWWTKADGLDLYNYLLGLDPNLVINERICRSFGIGDYECPEQEVPTSPKSRPWETCQTMNGSWGYNAADGNYKSSKTLIQQLVTVASRDGNYLLNIGPKGDGTVPSQSIDILNSFGDWMNIYGESIYGTTRSPFKTEPAWGVYTKKPNKLFAHIFVWPVNGLLRIPSLSNTINKIYLMNDTTTSLNYTDSSGCITISLPAKAPNANNSVVVVDVTGVPTLSSKYVKVSGITVSSFRKLITISMKDTLQMNAGITPTNAAIKSVIWSVSDTAKASISIDGLLSSKKNGKIDVIASAKDGTDIKGKLQITITTQTAIDDWQDQALPGTPFLEQNYPNPFNPDTIIRFTIPKAGHVSLKVFNVLGNEVADLVDENKPAGTFESSFSLSNLSLTSGVYFYTLRSGNYFETKKMVVVK